MLRAHAKLIRSIVVAVDVLAAALVFLGAVGIPELCAPHALEGSESAARLLAAGLVASLSWPFLLDLLGLYGSQRRQDVGRLIARMLLAGVASATLLAGAGYIVEAPVSWLFAPAVGGAQVCVLVGLRLVGIEGLRFFRRRGRNTRYVLIVGSGSRARHVVQVLERHAEWGLQVVGFLDDGDLPHDPRIPAERIFKLVDLPRLLTEKVIDEVIVACPRSMLGNIGPVVATCATAGVPLTLLSDLFGDYLPPPQVTRFGSLAALSFAPVHHSRSLLILKRAMDVAGAAFLLAVSAPVVAIAAMAIKLDSRGPVFFRQIRCGQYGRPFSMLKLRTMTVDAEERRAELLGENEMQGPVFKMRNDPRVTAVGRILRRLSLDEVPQFWNVLRGDMSLVGPRPPLPHEVSAYATFDRRRLSMRPGITCLWQVGGRNAVDFENWVKLDLAYIDTWSITSDVKILLRTIPAILRGTGV